LSFSFTKVKKYILINKNYSGGGGRNLLSKWRRVDLHFEDEVILVDRYFHGHAPTRGGLRLGWLFAIALNAAELGLWLFTTTKTICGKFWECSRVKTVLFFIFLWT
jgi:hypothetical protein